MSTSCFPKAYSPLNYLCLLSIQLSSPSPPLFSLCVCVCVCACMRVCMHVYVCSYLHNSYVYESMMSPLILIHRQTVYSRLPLFFIFLFSAIATLILATYNIFTYFLNHLALQVLELLSLLHKYQSIDWRTLLIYIVLLASQRSQNRLKLDQFFTAPC